MRGHHYLAFDLGAESGRGMLGTFDDGKLKIAEVHRFPNIPALLPDGLHWDALRLWSEILATITLVARKQGHALNGIGIDTWGVDYALLDRGGGLVSNPYHYRDTRTDGMIAQVCKRMPRQEIFEYTGVQFLQLNTLIQLFAAVQRNAPELDNAAHLVMMPDLFNYFLTGEIACEFSTATTTQCYDPRQRDWCTPLLERMGIPRHIFPKIIPSGTVLGNVRAPLIDETGARDVRVIAPACHDTGSAAAAVPAARRGFAWISSGTWSIMGAELDEPVINAASLAFNFTNEGGVNNTIRFCKNIAGMWFVQELRRAWALEGEDLSYDEITQLAAQAKPLQCIIEPDARDFFGTGDMPEHIRAYCLRTGQYVPQTKGEFARCALESIACKYRWVLERMEETLGYCLEPIHIVGGGTKNKFLSQLTADATGRTVITGPVEATAIGNLIVQAIALGDIASLDQARALIRESFPLHVFQPQNHTQWADAYARFCALMESPV